MNVHPAALVLADHIFMGHPNRGPGRCSCQYDDHGNYLGEAVGWRGHACDHPVHLAEVLAEAALLADGTGGRFAEFSVHGDGNSDAWLWHEPCRTELDAIGDPWTLVELVASARSHLSGCVGAT